MLRTLLVLGCCLGACLGPPVSGGPEFPPSTLTSVDAGEDAGCPASSAPRCMGGQLATVTDANGCEGVRCECPSLRRYEPSRDACLVGPVLDFLACPAYAGAACLLQLPPTSPGQEQSGSVTVKNGGETPLHLFSVRWQEPAPPELTVGVLPAQLAPGAWAELRVTYRPKDAGTALAALLLRSDAINGERRLPVEASTPGTRCTADKECPHQYQCLAGACESCPFATPPPCYSGSLHGVPFGNGCNSPVCTCRPGEVYVRGHCYAAGVCASTADCGGAACDGRLCREFPCSAHSPDAGYCAPDAG